MFLQFRSVFEQNIHDGSQFLPLTDLLDDSWKFCLESIDHLLVCEEFIPHGLQLIPVWKLRDLDINPVLVTKPLPFGADQLKSRGEFSSFHRGHKVNGEFKLLAFLHLNFDDSFCTLAECRPLERYELGAHRPSHLASVFDQPSFSDWLARGDDNIIREGQIFDKVSSERVLLGFLGVLLHGNRSRFWLLLCGWNLFRPLSRL
mmetsp:Transcript_2383/g.5441  ORF Transcript_2383/g.5441 Transcript_2383/m.5441 type:complete len:203 (-) Transcript_2383:1245-1853(-)